MKLVIISANVINEGEEKEWAAQLKPFLDAGHYVRVYAELSITAEDKITDMGLGSLEDPKDAPIRPIGGITALTSLADIVFRAKSNFTSNYDDVDTMIIPTSFELKLDQDSREGEDNPDQPRTPLLLKVEATPDGGHFEHLTNFLKLTPQPIDDDLDLDDSTTVDDEPPSCSKTLSNAMFRLFACCFSCACGCCQSCRRRDPSYEAIQSPRSTVS